MEGFPHYEVSNTGKVRRKGKLLKQFEGGGYKRVALYNGSNASKKQFSVHRLVAHAFIPNPEEKQYVNHKDENKLNNTVSN